MFLPTYLQAYVCEIDGIYYNLQGDGTATVTTGNDYHYGSYSGEIIIPTEINYAGKAYSVTSISDRAFAICSGLTVITIPNSVTSIGKEAFWGCTSLTAVNITDIAAWCNISFANAKDSFYNYISSNPLYYAHHLYLNGEEVKNLVIPNSVTNIGSYAFYGYSGLTAVTIPNSVTTIGDSTFYGCNGLTAINIPNSVTTIGSSAFYGCSGLAAINIPNSVTNIGSSAFYGCSGLAAVNIPESVTSIGNSTFHGCTNLTAVNITDLAAWCNISFGTDASNPLYYAHHLYLNGEEVKDLDIPNSVTSIGNYAFYGCSGLTSITIPNSVTSIGIQAFSECSGLTAVNITDLASWYNISFKSNPLSYAHHLYLNGEEVKDLVIPSSVTNIGKYAFSGCSGLTSITIPNSVTTIGECAFSGCSGLTSITIPNSVTNIGKYAFSGCSGLTSITIPNSVTTIGECAFSGCSGLTSITIPNSVTNIGKYAFAYCI